MNKTTCRFLLVGLCSLIQVTSAYAINAGLDPSLIGWWNLDDGSGTVAKDSSGSGYDGTVQGGATWTAGQFDGAIQFNGPNAYIQVTHIPLDNRSFTIAMWAPPTVS